MFEPDIDIIRVLHYRGEYYLIAQLQPGIDQLEWARLSQRIGQLDQMAFSLLQQRLDEDFFPKLLNPARKHP